MRTHFTSMRLRVRLMSILRRMAEISLIKHAIWFNVNFSGITIIARIVCVLQIGEIILILNMIWIGLRWPTWIRMVVIPRAVSIVWHSVFLLLWRIVAHRWVIMVSLIVCMIHASTWCRITSWIVIRAVTIIVSIVWSLKLRRHVRLHIIWIGLSIVPLIIRIIWHWRVKWWTMIWSNAWTIHTVSLVVIRWHHWACHQNCVAFKQSDRFVLFENNI